jgi:hypothetical protein
MTFCSAATRAASRKNTMTVGPPCLSSERLAAKPIEAKKPFCSGTCRVVSKAST